MALNNESHQPVAKKRLADNAAIRLCGRHAEHLKRVNKKVTYFLDRLPLKDQRDIVELNRLIEEQERLVRVRLIGHVPLKIEVFNENERYRAMHLSRRFKYAQRWDKIKKSED